MARTSALIPTGIRDGYLPWLRDAQLGWQNLLVHGLRSLLTMMGMIFGVAAVVAMLSIGAGARQKVMSLIEQMGVHNLIVEAKETTEWQAHSKIRKTFAGAHASGLSHHARRCCRRRSLDPAQTAHSLQDISEAAAGDANCLRGQSRVRADCRPSPAGRAASSIKPTRPPQRLCACWGLPPNGVCSDR